MISRRLLRAYAATDYLIPSADLSLMPYRRNPALVAWLRRQGAQRVAILTACNPRSHPLSKHENAKRNIALAAELQAASLRHFDASGTAQRGNWPAESSFAILDISLARLDALGRRWHQNAALVAGRDGRPRLRCFTAGIGSLG